MILIKNKTKGPIQLVVKSFSDKREHTKALTTLNIPGLKSVIVKDEIIVSDYLKRLEDKKLLSSEYIKNKDSISEEK